ncbi:MAG TPA: FkbM family methyltransferase [Chitinophagales bacterium]|nr:FkbM family methyltransferase [Chitinophagales bacterium]
MIEVRLKHYPHPIFIRRKTSDIAAFEQIFARGGYDINYPNLSGDIMDAGAYTGLSTIFFANRFPDKKIIAIEPDRENFSMLIKNTQKYKNVKAYHGAVWNRNTTVVIMNKESSFWGFQVEETDNEQEGIEALTIDEIMRLEKLKEIAILKMDVEGSEKEIFSGDFDSWLPHVHCLIVELHDRFKPGSGQAVEKAVQKIQHRKFFKVENEIYFLHHTSS